MTIKDGFNNGDPMYCYPDTMVLKNKWIFMTRMF